MATPSQIPSTLQDISTVGNGFKRTRTEEISPTYPPNRHVTPLHSTTDNYTSATSYLQLLFDALLPRTLILDNSASTARDHLANERTWLAYMRTSLAFVGTGIALVQLLKVTSFDSMAAQADMANLSALGPVIERFIRPLGTSIIFVGIGVLLLGLQRYFRIQKALLRGLFPAAIYTVVVLTTVLLVFVVIIFSILLTLT